MTLPKDRTIVASDVNLRDGIGVEIYRNNELVVEIFRDDTKFSNKKLDLSYLKNVLTFSKKKSLGILLTMTNSTKNR